jgi:hypothetical protein
LRFRNGEGLRVSGVEAGAIHASEGDAMNAWTSQELNTIGSADEIRIAGRRADGTLRKPVTIWIVPYQGRFYVRSVNGRDAAWFRGTQERHEGRIWAGDVERDVAFKEAPGEIADQLDEVYRAKYRRYPPNIVGSILRPQARAAALEVVPT